MTVSADPSGDTIVAIATPPGTGALAIVRLSGPAALAVADGAFRGRRPLREAATHTAHYGRIVQHGAALGSDGDEVAEYRGVPRAGAPRPETARGDGLEVVDDVIATVFRAPASYTGEDTVEITCHGSNLVAATVVAALLRQGARAAEPGEFTRRAFLNGKLDLTQAEAVAEVIQSATAAALRGARNRLNGALGAQVAGLATAVAGVCGARRAGAGLRGRGRGAGAGGRDRRACGRGAQRHRRDARDLPHWAHAPRRRARGAGGAAQRGQVVAAEPAGAGIAGAGHRHTGHYPRRDPRGPRHPRGASEAARHRRSAGHRRDRGAAGRGAQPRHRRRRRPGAVRDRRGRAVFPIPPWSRCAGRSPTLSPRPPRRRPAHRTW